MGKELFHTSLGGMGSPEDGGEAGLTVPESDAGKTTVGGGVGGISATGMSHTTKYIVITYAMSLSPTRVAS